MSSYDVTSAELFDELKKQQLEYEALKEAVRLLSAIDFNLSKLTSDKMPEVLKPHAKLLCEVLGL